MKSNWLIPVVALCTMSARETYTSAQKAPVVHELKATPSTVHRGFFDASLKPLMGHDYLIFLSLARVNVKINWEHKSYFQAE